MTRRSRRGVVLPVVLAVMVALALLSSLALFSAVQEWRVASLAGDRVDARAAALSALGSARTPPDLAALCISPPVTEQIAAVPVVGRGSARITWRHLGGGAVRAEVTGTGTHGARSRLVALLRPDSSERVAGLFRCPTATVLTPVGDRSVEGHPEG